MPPIRSFSSSNEFTTVAKILIVDDDEMERILLHAHGKR